MNTETIDILKQIALAASKDPTRAYINSVVVVKKGETLTAYASDGHMAVIRPIHDDDLRVMLIENESLIFEISMLKLLKSKYPLTENRLGSTVELKTQEMLTLYCKVVSGHNYPFSVLDNSLKVRKVKPIKISFDAELLARLADSLKDCKKDKSIVTLEFDAMNVNNAIVVNREGVKGLLMPCKGYKDIQEENNVTLGVKNE